MNGKKAKLLRRTVYGDFSPRERQYEEINHGIKTKRDGKGNEFKIKAITVRNTGRREVYQKAKRAYYGQQA